MEYKPLKLKDFTKITLLKKMAFNMILNNNND